MIVVSKVRKPDNFELHNSLKLTLLTLKFYQYILDLRSDIVGCKSFFESKTSLIFLLNERKTLCEKNSIDSSYFSMRGNLSLIRKTSGTHVYGLRVSVKEEICNERGFLPINPTVHELSLETLR